MWQTPVLAHFHLFRVNENEAHLVGCAAHEQRSNDAVQPARLTRTSGACNEQVRCCCEVNEHCTTRNVFAHSNIEWMCCCFRLCRRNEVAQGNKLTRCVGNFNTNCRTPRNRSENTHVGCCHCIGNIAVEACNARNFYTWPKFQLVTRDRRANGHANELHVYAVRSK